MPTKDRSENVAIDAFLEEWLRSKLDGTAPVIVSDLAHTFRKDALSADYPPEQIERRLGATIEEAIMAALDGWMLDAEEARCDARSWRRS